MTRKRPLHTKSGVGVVPHAARRVGVREVAAHAGVSTQTVSRVINDHPNIRAATRERVILAMEELGYRFNNTARALGTSTTRTLGIVASDATLYGPSVGIARLEAAARAHGRWVATAYADASDAGSVTAAVAHLLTQGVDGIVVLAPHLGTLEVARASAPGVRVVAMHSGVGGEAQHAAAAAVIAHLVAVGHRRIARVAGPAEWSEAAARDRGAVEGMLRSGATPGPRWEGDWTAASGFALAGDVAAAVAEPDGPTAIAVANDQMALGLIAGLEERGIGVPARVSVTGFDDNPDAAYYRPALTTVRIDLDGEAQRVLAAALDLAAAPSPSPPVLVVRASTAPPS